MSNSTGLDGEIEELERRISAFEKVTALSHPHTKDFSDANAALNIASRRLVGLQERRAKVEAGLPDPEARPPAPLAPARRAALRIPRRIAKKAGASGRKEAHIEQPLSEELQTELEGLLEKYAGADAIEKAEDSLREIAAEYTKAGATSEAAFTESLYGAFVVKLAALQVNMQAIGEFQLNRRRELEAHIQNLTTRVAELEAKPTVKYLGVYDDKIDYPAGALCTHGGSMWHANIQTKGVTPGDGRLWTLCVKKGRDARDDRSRSASA